MMKLLRGKSLQMRLATRLGALFLVATLGLMAAFFYLSYSLVETLSRQDLFDLADELAEGIRRDGIDVDVDDLIEDSLLNQFTRYAVFDGRERVLVASDDAFVEAVLALNPDFGNTSLLSLTLAHASGDTLPGAADNQMQAYQGLITTERSERGRVTVAVAEPERSERARMAALVRDMIVRATWLIPLLIALTLLVGVMAIRSGLQPLRRTAQETASITPESLSHRLDTNDLPAEVFPLVSAVNDALDRLEAGFELQRRFTANAAHELRTPLAIISAAVDGIDDSPALIAVRDDIARMSRLVEQLLHVARLDSQVIHASEPVDLLQVACRVVEQMAPIAIARGHSIGLDEQAVSTVIQGNALAIEDALRNLVENAIVHGSAHNTIDIHVARSGAVSVCDRGPGIQPDDQPRLFDRFWRGRQAAGTGAGLGLSIVQEVMRQHGGSVTMSANAHGGSSFTLQF